MLRPPGDSLLKAVVQVVRVSARKRFLWEELIAHYSSLNLLVVPSSLLAVRHHLRENCLQARIHT